LFAVFKSNQIRVTEQLQQWYTNCKKPRLSSCQLVSANYVDKRRDKGAVDLEKLYADMVDLVGKRVRSTMARVSHAASRRSVATLKNDTTTQTEVLGSQMGVSAASRRDSPTGRRDGISPNLISRTPHLVLNPLLCLGPVDLVVAAFFSFVVDAG